MALTCNILNPLQRDGTSQRQRFLEALSPQSVLVDERDLADLLLYVRQYASFLRYYTPSNGHGGNWVAFIEQDISTLVSMIRDTDFQKEKQGFVEQKDQAFIAQGTDQAGHIRVLSGLFFDLARVFDGWIRRSIPGLALHTALVRLLQSVLQDTLRESLSVAFRLNEVGFSAEIPELTEWSPLWNISQPPSDSSLFPSGDMGNGDDVRGAILRLSSLFDRLYEALVFLVGNADSYLEETLERYPEHQPHMALFLSFLKIFDYAQQHMNLLTGKHLDFYYHKVLGLQHREEIPDHVQMVFELAKNFTQHRIPDDTPLKAGKDALGRDLVYSTDSELVVNQARLSKAHGLQGVYVDVDDEGVVKNIYAAPVANSADGHGEEIVGEEKKWKAFGSPDWPYATIGFAMASPMFFLKEGKRTIRVQFNVADSSDLGATKTRKKIAQELRHNVEVWASGDKEWLPITIQRVEFGGEVSDQKGISAEKDPGIEGLSYTLCLDETLGVVAGYDDAVFQEGFATTFPVLKFLLKNSGLSAKQVNLTRAPTVNAFNARTTRFEYGDLVHVGRTMFRSKFLIERPGFHPQAYPAMWDTLEPSYAYKYFQKIDISSVEITVAVTGVRSLLLENDVGMLDPAKPFHPFGPIPRKESSFLIGSREIFQKSVTRIDLDMKWADLPEENFNGHYSEYPNVDIANKGNEHFKANASLLMRGQWEDALDVEIQAKKKGDEGTPIGEGASSPLFLPRNSADPPTSDLGLSLKLPPFSRDSKFPEFVRFDTTLQQGFLRLTLNQSFLHGEYPRVLAQAAKTPLSDIPNQPYTPLMASLSLDYEAQECVEYTSLTKDDFSSRVEQLYQIGPFGKREIFPINDESHSDEVLISKKLVPEFEVTKKVAGGQVQLVTAQGTFYIGLENVHLPQNISLLFQMAEGSEDPEKAIQTIIWSYLTRQEWRDFLPGEIISDSTNGLLTSGVVKFSLPQNMVNEGTLMPKGPYWIKASVRGAVDAVPQCIAVHPQAAAASFRNHGNDSSHLAQALPAETISKLQIREAPIKAVSQPYASFGGRMKETDEAFSIRVSERLRHKERAVTIFDYERLVLEHFPEVYKVKCVNHTSSHSEYAPGSVRVVVVPNLRNKNAVDPFRPLLSLNVRERIKEFLKSKSSNFLSIEVVNPQYEHIQVLFDVRFQAGRDKGFYTTQLNQDIIRFLSPWLYDNGADLTFGGRIHRSAILNVIEESEYVNFVTNFRMHHQRADQSWIYNVEEARATSSSAAFVSHEQHQIGHDIVSCEDVPQVEDSLPAPSESDAPTHEVPQGVQRYVGNRVSLEIHDLANPKPQCQTNEIAEDRRIYFRKIAQATAKGYDFCAYCFSRGLSKR